MVLVCYYLSANAYVLWFAGWVEPW